MLENKRGHMSLVNTSGYHCVLVMLIATGIGSGNGSGSGSGKGSFLRSGNFLNSSFLGNSNGERFSTLWLS